MNTLKFSGIAALAAFAGFATTVEAALPAVDASFYVSGASAAKQVPPALAASNCDLAAATATAGDPIVYDFDNAGSPTADYKVTICTLKTSLPGGATGGSGANNSTQLGGKRVAIFSRAAGGSLFGVKPVGARQKIKFIDGSTCPAADLNPATTQHCTGLLSSADYDAAGNGQIPDVGISDEDGKFVCNVALGNQCTPTELAGLASSKYVEYPVYQTVWTIQTGKDFGKLNGGDAQITNLSSEVISGIFSGTIQSVQQVQKIMGLPVSTGATKGLKVCSRTDTSGTKSAAIQLYTGAPYCGSTAVLGFVNATAADANGYTVVNNSSATTLENCLSAAADLTRTVGINSLENAGNNANIVEVSINGTAATLPNAAKGTYPWYMESTAQYNTDQLSDGAITRSTTAQRTAFADLWVTESQNPARLVAAGLGGELGIPTVTSPTDPYDPANPVGWTSKFVGAGGNNCRLPQPGFPSYP